ncbi:MAG: response regulator transcription factor [Ornithinimicrobium sp.]
MSQPGASRRSILVVEDDPTINQALSDRLTAEGFTVARAFDGPGALTAYAAHKPDLVLLDVMLPGLDGLEVCRLIQSQRPVPVLMLTAKDDENDMLLGLAVGADDYVTKPFRMREVMARTNALLRRVERATTLVTDQQPALSVGGLVIDRAAHTVAVHDTPVHLTPLEFDLLVMLAEQPGTVHSREALMTQVWGWADARGTRTLDSHIKSLRSKIGPERVRTVHGVGYALEG